MTRPLHQYRATCARCRATSARLEAPTMAELFDRLRALGWRLVAAVGWVCPGCIGGDEGA